eukprot:1021489-Amphidinium_carterae.1
MEGRCFPCFVMSSRQCSNALRVAEFLEQHDKVQALIGRTRQRGLCSHNTQNCGLHRTHGLELLPVSSACRYKKFTIQRCEAASTTSCASDRCDQVEL